MSTTFVGQPDTTSSWKQEVSLRIAAHKSRRGWPTVRPAAPAPDWTAASSRAAQAAARVAARYAQAPSYSQMQAAEAPSAPPAAVIEIAEAPQASAAQTAFAELPVAAAVPLLWESEAPLAVEAARSSARDWEPAVASLHPAAPASLEDWENECAHSRWEPDPRLLPLEPASVPVPAPIPIPAPIPVAEAAPRSSQELEPPAFAPLALASEDEVRWEWQPMSQQYTESEEIEPVEPDLPIHANLIEFPRELVATRKMRPHRAEGPFAVQRTEMQLSIFEVDPGAISTSPEPTCTVPIAAWPEPAWAEIELEPQTHEEAEQEETPAAMLALHLAPFGRRLMAALADGALIAGVILIPALAAGALIGYPHATKVVELGAILAFLLAGLLYNTLFLTLAEATPGMRFARISLCTFDGQIPTRAQLRSRLGALLLSMVPLGLGVAWALFDDDRLSWHDRLSRTYPRMY